MSGYVDPTGPKPASPSMSSNQPLIDIIAGARPNFMKIAPIMRAHRRRARRGQPAALPPGAHRPALRRAHVGRLLRAARHPRAGRQPRSRLGHAGRADGGDHDALRAAAAEGSAATCAWWSATSPRPWPAPSPRRSCACRWRMWKAASARATGRMPEEINRLVTDAITNWFFTTSEVANENLRTAGRARRAHLLRRQHDDRHAAGQPAAPAPAGVLGRARACSRASYFVMTLHRPANVDDERRLRAAAARRRRGAARSAGGLSGAPAHRQDAGGAAGQAGEPAAASTRSPTWSSTTWCGTRTA